MTDERLKPSSQGNAAVGGMGKAFLAVAALSLAYGPARLAACGILLGFGYGLGFRFLAGRMAAPRSSARWLILAKIPVLILVLAGLGRLGVPALLGFPLGFLGQLGDLVLLARREKA